MFCWVFFFCHLGQMVRDKKKGDTCYMKNYRQSATEVLCLVGGEKNVAQFFWIALQNIAYTGQVFPSILVAIFLAFIERVVAHHSGWRWSKNTMAESVAVSQGFRAVRLLWHREVWRKTGLHRSLNAVICPVMRRIPVSIRSAKPQVGHDRLGLGHRPGRHRLYPALVSPASSKSQ